MRCKKKPVVTPANRRIGVGAAPARSEAAKSAVAAAAGVRADRALVQPARCNATAAMEAATWRNELEALQRLLARQQSQISALQQLGSARADDGEEVDIPASEYTRVFAVTVALLVYTNASMLTSSFTAGGIEGNLSQIEYLIWPLCWTLAFGLVLGTLDSSKAGRRAIQLTRGWLFSQVVFVPLLYWTSGQKQDALGFVFVFLLNAIYWPWLAMGMRETLCTKYRGTLTTQAQLYTNRCLKVLGFQV